MKRIFVIGLALLAVLVAVPALAQEGSGPADKFNRGAVNVACGWTEPLQQLFVPLFRQPADPLNYALFIPRVVWGGVLGAARTLTGVFEVATFYVPTPPPIRPVNPCRIE